MPKIGKAKLAKLEGKDGKLKVGDFLAWWLDPKNGKVGETYLDRTGTERKTKSFHSVTSGFNEACKAYYGLDTKGVIAMTNEAETRGLISIRPTRGGVKGVRISLPTDGGSGSRGISALAEMGLNPS